MVRCAGARVPENFDWNGLAAGFKISVPRDVSCCGPWRPEMDGVNAGSKDSVV